MTASGVAFTFFVVKEPSLQDSAVKINEHPSVLCKGVRFIVYPLQYVKHLIKCISL